MEGQQNWMSCPRAVAGQECGTVDCQNWLNSCSRENLDESSCSLSRREAFVTVEARRDEDGTSAMVSGKEGNHRTWHVSGQIFCIYTPGTNCECVTSTCDELHDGLGLLDQRPSKGNGTKIGLVTQKRCNSERRPVEFRGPRV